MIDESDVRPAGAEDMRRHFVFVSHASTDDTFVRQFVVELEASGVPCWVSYRDILGSENFSREIPVALLEAEAVVLILTPAAMASDYVLRELQLANRRKRRVFPIVPQRFALNDAFDFEISDKQWIDSADPKHGANKLAQTLAGLGLPFEGKRQPKSSTASKSRQTSLILAVGLALAIFVIAAGIYYARPTPPSEPDWRALPTATNPMNGSQSDGILRPQPDGTAPSLGRVRPGTRLFLFSEPKALSFAKVGGRKWLRYNEAEKWFYILQDGLCSSVLQPPCPADSLK